MKPSIPFSLLAASFLTLACQPETTPNTASTTLELSEPAATTCPIIPQRKALFGDLHVHTTYSFDAYNFDTRMDPSDAYDYAKGLAPAMLPPLRFNRGTRELLPVGQLDFAAVTDHAEWLGEASLCTDRNSTAYSSDDCRAYRSLTPETFLLAQRIFGDSTLCDDGSCDAALRDVWSRTVEAAALANEPCTFTAFPAFEWTLSTGGNQHRNVIFNGAVSPPEPINSNDVPAVEDLWTMLDNQCRSAGNGCDVIAIPHNVNLSNGLIFTPENSDGTPLSFEDAVRRQEMEPLVEIYQHKGDSECRYDPLSNDEGCRFEKIAAQEQPELSFVRSALTEGVRIHQELGANPFKAGIIGSTDTHNATPGAVAEDGFEGHVGMVDPDEASRARTAEFSPGGLAVVWATQNTRQGVFRALKRRETYGTSGPRIVVRFFGGWEYPMDLCSNANFVERGYLGGVPMGGTLSDASGTDAKPEFAVLAEWDPGQGAKPGALLNQIEIIKGWVDSQGERHEQVVPVAWTDGGVGTVNLNTCTPLGPGEQSLCAVWRDDGFNTSEHAYYYARVRENPTCRWSWYDCLAVGVDAQCSVPPPDGFEHCCDGSVARVVQERAWTSPIWYVP